jgi:hypothetical protein
MLCCTILICTVWWTGAVPQMVLGHDVMVLLEGGWKSYWGFAPHKDFYSPFGALTFLLLALGIEISGSLVHAIPAATCIVAFVALPLAVYASFTRLHPLIATAAAVVIIAACVAPHELRFSHDDWSYAAIYNRWAYALFGVLMLIISAVPFKPRRWKDLADGLIAGSCIMLMIFLKISYGLLALALFAAFAPVHVRKRAYWLSALISSLVWLAVFGFLLEWGFSYLLEDMRIASQARQGLEPSALVGWTLTLRIELLALAALAGIWCVTGMRTKSVSLVRRTIESGWIFAAFAGSAGAILMTNSPLGWLSESPIVGLGALVLLSGIVGDVHKIGASAAQRFVHRAPIVLGLCLAPFALLPVTARNLGSVAAAAEFKRSGGTLSPAEMFTAGPLKGLQISGFGGDPPLPTTYVGKVKDGLNLLTCTGNADKPVAALDFANPFNVVRGVRPSRTAPPAWQLGFLFSPESAPSAARVFDRHDVIMWPKQFGDGNQQNLTVMLQHYGAYLAENYRLAGESRQWQLFVPKMTGYRRSPRAGAHFPINPRRRPACAEIQLHHARRPCNAAAPCPGSGSPS